jgi:hypothetical protein
MSNAVLISAISLVLVTLVLAANADPEFKLPMAFGWTEAAVRAASSVRSRDGVLGTPAGFRMTIMSFAG